MKRLKSLVIFAVIALTFSVQAQDKVLFSGDSWVNKSKKTSGSWQVVEQGDKRFIVLGEKFKTSKGPDLKLFLFKSALADVGKKQKIEATGKQVAELKSLKGAQRYELPAGIDLKAYKSLILHCEKYTVVWGGVDLK